MRLIKYKAQVASKNEWIKIYSHRDLKSICILLLSFGLSLHILVISVSMFLFTIIIMYRNLHCNKKMNNELERIVTKTIKARLSTLLRSDTYSTNQSAPWYLIYHVSLIFVYNHWRILQEFSSHQFPENLICIPYKEICATLNAVK